MVAVEAARVWQDANGRTWHSRRAGHVAAGVITSAAASKSQVAAVVLEAVVSQGAIYLDGSNVWRLTPDGEAWLANNRPVTIAQPVKVLSSGVAR